MISLKIALRNIRRQRTRTWLTISAITFCTAAVLLTMAWARGQHQGMIQTAATMFTGHFQIQMEGYLDDPSLDKGFSLPRQMIRSLEEQEKVTGVAPRALTGGLVSSDQNTSGGIIVGVDPSREAASTTLCRKVREGRFLEAGDEKRVLVGEVLARNLKVGVGEEVQLMVQSFYGSLELRFYRVAGIVKTGSPEFDQALVIMPLSEMQDFLEMEDMVTEVAVVLDSPRAREPVMEVARSELESSEADGLVIVLWEDILPELVEFVLLDNAGGVLYLAILVIVVAFLVLLTITMSVMERLKEFGVLLAIGTRPTRIFQTIMIESFLMGIIGTLLGLVMGSIPSYYWSVHPIRLEQYAEMFQEFGMEPVLSTILIPAMYWSTTLIMMVVVMGVSIFPAVRASRIVPVDALRHA